MRAMIRLAVAYLLVVGLAVSLALGSFVRVARADGVNPGTVDGYITSFLTSHGVTVGATSLTFTEADTLDSVLERGGTTNASVAASIMIDTPGFALVLGSLNGAGTYLQVDDDIATLTAGTNAGISGFSAGVGLESAVICDASTDDVTVRADNEDPVATFSGAGITLAAGNTVSAPTLTSTVATGTAPLTVTSTTLVTNLNADTLDGLDSTAFSLAGAAGTPWITFTASNVVFPAASAAGLVARNLHGAIAYDGTADEFALFMSTLDDSYASGSNLVVKVYWTAASATSGDAVLTLEWEFVNPGTLDIDGDSFDTLASQTTTTSGTTGVLNTTTFTLANGAIDDQTAGTPFRMRIGRDADNVADTINGTDVYVHYITIEQ